MTQNTDDTLQNCTLDTYVMLLTNVTLKKNFKKNHVFIRMPRGCKYKVIYTKYVKLKRIKMYELIFPNDLEILKK